MAAKLNYLKNFSNNSFTITFARKNLNSMKQLFSGLKVHVNKNLYLKDPGSSDLGKRILNHSIILLNEIGFEGFTFKKLGVEIGSNESSIYRYFENKHKLLLYLTSWYWGWKEYHLVFGTNNISDPKHKLEKAVDILTRSVENDSQTSHIDEMILNKVVVNEYSRSYLIKELDRENKEDFWDIYNRLVFRLKELILNVNPAYPYASSLANTVLEGALHQHFLKENFPALTEFDSEVSPTDFFKHLVFSTLKITPND